MGHKLGFGVGVGIGTGVRVSLCDRLAPKAAGKLRALIESFPSYVSDGIL